MTVQSTKRLSDRQNVRKCGRLILEIRLPQYEKARKKQLKNQVQNGELYHRNYYKEVQNKNRVYYEYYSLEDTQDIPADYNEISFACLRLYYRLETPSTLSIACRTLAKKLDGFEGFHFHQLRHPNVKPKTKNFHLAK